MTDTVKLNQSKWLNKLLTFICALGVTLSVVAPFSHVYAESTPTYMVITAGTPITYNNVDLSLNTGEARIVYLTGSFGPKLFFVSDSNDTSQYITFRNNSTTSTTGGTMDITTTISNVTYNYKNFNKSGPVSTWINGALADGFTGVADEALGSKAVYYTYGAGAVDPAPALDPLGVIEDVKYSTQINSHGDDTVDTISWYPYFDSLNNPAVGWNAQIRIVPGYYYDSDRDSLLQQAFNLFHKEENQAELVYDDHFVQGSFSITWGEVRNKISITSWQDLFGSFVSVLDGTYWYKRGWIYQIRIYDRDNDRYSEWQDIYNVTSSSGEGVEKIIDPTDGGGLPDYYNNVENSFNTTSVVNNNYNVVYYYINTPIETNPSDDDANEYLKDIRNNVRQIRRMLAIDNNADATPDNNNDPWSGNPAAELYDFENRSINDFNDAVSDLPTSDLVTGNKFLAASTWVRTQYETLVVGTPFEAIIVFSLLLGFGLLLIGKLR